MQRPGLRSVLLAALLVSLFSSLVWADALRPNILWITCEDTSPTLGCYGDKFARTPNLDALAARSVRYTKAFATAPVCAPSRACLITGVYATTLGNAPLRCAMPIPPSIKSYAALLREAGYFTSNNRKTDYNLQDEKAFIARSWDRCDGTAHWRQRKPSQPFLSVFNITHTHQSNASVSPWPKFEALARKNLSADERSDPTKVPLPPYYPDTQLARRTMARYYDCVAMMDKEAGRILRELESDGLADDTIVFFYSDHGMGMPRGKRTLFDSGLHVPLIIHFPKKYTHLAPATPGQATDRLVSFVDFAPTVLNLAGLPVPQYMQGIPFLGSNAGPPRTLVYGARDRVDEAFEMSRSVSDGRWLYIRNYFPHLSWMQPEAYSDGSDFRRELARLARDGKLNAAQLTYAGPRKAVEELYDTTADPHQIHNLAAEPQHASRLGRLRRAHRQWVLETRDLGFVPEQQLLERTRGGTPYEVGQNHELYPLERILATAELVGRPGSGPFLSSRLPDLDPTVRYWALVGFRAARRADAVPSPSLWKRTPSTTASAASTPAPVSRDHLEDVPITHEIVKLLEDPAAAVRIEAAGLLVDLDDPKAGDALRLLAGVLHGKDSDAALHAARTLELLGERARPVLAEIRKARQASSGQHGDPLVFALDAMLRNLQERP